jgi:hypothetical protein
VYFYDQWESDLLEITKIDLMVEYEIKASRSDFFADFDKKLKHYHLENGLYCPNHFYYVSAENVIQIDDVPEHAGLLWVNQKGFIRIKKQAPLLNDNRLEPQLWEKIAKTLYVKLG